MNLIVPLFILAALAAPPALSAGDFSSETSSDPVARSPEVPKSFSDRNARPSPDWIKDAVLYEVYLRAFSKEGKIYNLEARLGELKKLGVTCVWLMPVHPVGVENKKGTLGCPYSVRDYRGFSMEYGTKDSFREFVASAHELGLKVVIDWVANHTAWDNGLLISTGAAWYQRDAQGKAVPPHPDWTDVAALDYRSRDLRKYMKETMVSWVREYDIDGFRCDVADLMPLDFWEEARRDLDRIKPGLLMLAEGTNPEDHLAAFDMTYAEEFFKMLRRFEEPGWSAASVEKMLEWEKETYPQGALFMRYIENHDQMRAEKAFGPAHFAFATLIFTLNGAPLVYNGQEIGETATPSLFEKEEIRWKESKIGLRSADETRKFYRRLASIRRGHPSLRRGQRFKVSVSDPDRVFAFVSSYRGDTAMVAINFSDKEFKGDIEIPSNFLSDKGKLNLEPLLDGPGLEVKSGGQAELVLAPWGAQIWQEK